MCVLVTGEDFMSDASLMIAISGSDFNSEKCVNITTNVDMTVEGNEVFDVTLVSTNPPSTTVTPTSQLAVILDNSSKLYLVTVRLNSYIPHSLIPMQESWLHLLMKYNLSLRVNCLKKCVLYCHTLIYSVMSPLQ